MKHFTKYLISCIVIPFLLPFQLFSQEAAETQENNGLSKTKVTNWTTEETGQSTIRVEQIATEAKLDNNFNIYPNPADQSIVAEFAKPLEGQVMIRIYDLKGQELIEQSIEVQKSIITISQLVPASYIIRVFINQKEAGSYNLIKM